MKKLKLQELAADLKADIDKLEAGALNANQLEKLVADARALHERLVIMHYLAQERLVKGKDTTEREQRVNFRLNAIHPGQTSLIDAIEELGDALEADPKPSKKQKKKAAKKDEAREEPPQSNESSAQMSIRIGMAGMPSNEEDEGQDEIHATEESGVKEHDAANQKSPSSDEEESTAQEEPATETEQEERSIPKEEGQSTPSSEQASLADKLRRTPVADLRKAISLNQKFQFIRELFDGESSRYDEVIDRMNGADDLPQAVKTLEEQVPQIRVKAEDDPVAATLLDLVERRFL